MPLLSLTFCKGDRGTEIVGKLPKITELSLGRPGFNPWCLVAEPALDPSTI